MAVTTFLGALGAPVSDSLLVRLAESVSLVEATLREQVRSETRLVEQVGSLTLTGGGKRLRPALVHLSALATGRTFDPNRAVMLGAAIEMVHMATLVHDDVLDDAATRRGNPTAFSVCGATASILGGDVLLAKAMALLAEDGDLAVIRAVSRAVVELAEGEVRELEARGDWQLSEHDHLQIVRMKTASFLECCCRVGAMIAGASEPENDALCTYGHHLGMAFQIVDDALDFDGDPAVTGKPVGTDVRDGQATLPLILARDGLPAQLQNLVSEKFGCLTEAEVEAVIAEIKASGSVGLAKTRAAGEAIAARRALDLLPESEERSLLAAVADFVVNRDH